MKTYARMLIFVLALILLALPSLAGKRSVVKASGDNPCDPTYAILRLCQQRGGTFNTSTCTCDLP